MIRTVAAPVVQIVAIQIKPSGFLSLLELYLLLANSNCFHNFFLKPLHDLSPPLIQKADLITATFRLGDDDTSSFRMLLGGEMAG